ncbi:hypothetical protein LUZ60_011853 [Juncus effusus]|nr:hypothetical protein LUZ60_011853 [Juncus effusus]
MALSLNPDAKIYTPYRELYYSPSILLNPNPNPYNLHYPSYFVFNQSPQLTSLIYSSPLPTPPYQYYYFPSVYIPFLSEPPPPSSHPKCLIEELDSDKTESEESQETKRPTKALVRSFKRSVVSKANRLVELVRHCHPHKRRGSVKVPHEDFKFKGEEAGLEGWTTVMIKNLPNRFSKEKMVSILDKHCREENKNLISFGEEQGEGESVVSSEYDFFYLPIDFKTKSNYGYAFVNFTTANAAVKLHNFLHGHSWEYLGSEKICEVNYARIQGLPDLVNHSRNSNYACNSDEFLPVRFEPPRNGYNTSTEHLIGKRTSY